MSKAQNNHTLIIPSHHGGSSQSNPLPLIYLRTLQLPRSTGEFCNTKHTFFLPEHNIDLEA
jgi:hypothetical protein